LEGKTVRNSGESLMAHFSKLRFLAGFILLLFWAAALAAPVCRAELLEMADTELAAVYAAGYTKFSWKTVGTEDIARMDINVEARMFANIGSLKTGYYTGGWDQDWASVQLGDAANDLVAKGLFVEMGFDTATINSPSARTLNYVKIGTPSMQGDISGTFNSFSGTISGAGITNVSRQNLGTTTITADGSGASDFSMTLSRIAGTNQMGFSFQWGSATKSP